MINRMGYRIAVASAGRFHLLDLARELSQNGFDVSFYSYLPQIRTAAFGLPRKCHVSLLFWMWPLVAWERLLPRLMTGFRQRLISRVLDWLVSQKLKRCDAFIFMSGIYVKAPLIAKSRFGAIVDVHRGSQHILQQLDILERCTSGEKPQQYFIERELQAYRFSNRISIPSVHVYRSFENYPAEQNKCLINPYGTDTAQFAIRENLSPRLGSRVLFLHAGAWSFRKGCDLLADAIQFLTDVELLHVGSVGDLPFQNRLRVRHQGKVDQLRLPKVFAQVDALVLASREDGFGLVLGQALASGLPVVCTDATGGKDLCVTPALSDRILVVKSNCVEALKAGLNTMSHRIRCGPDFMELTEKDLYALSWTAYGERYSTDLYTRLGSVSPAGRLVDH